MAKLKVELPAQSTVTLSASAVNLLMDKGSGDAALLYIYILSHSGEIDVESAAKRLSFSPDRIYSALDALSEIGLIGKSSLPQVRERGDEIPEYSQRDVAEHMGSDADFKSLVSFCEEKLGKLLSTVDLQVLLGIYSWLGLPPDVICLLITSCIEETKKKYGLGRVPTMRTIEKRAKVWVRDGIMTAGRAEEYLKELEKLGSDKARVASICGIHGRALAPTEDRYISEWLRLELSDELIASAYDKTVTNTGSLKWRYMDKILQAWFSDGVRRVSDLENKPSPNASAKTSGADISAAERLRELNRRNQLKKE